MKKMKRHIAHLTLIFTLLLTACDDFLVKYPHDALPIENAFKTQDDIEVALRGVYSAFKSSAYYGRNFIVVPDLMTDQVMSVLGFSNEYESVYHWDYSASDENVTASWQIMYQVIGRSNTIIENADEVSGDKIALDHMKGQAYAARALAHFDLLRLFGTKYIPFTGDRDLGIPYKLTFSQGDVPRDVMDEVYKNVIDDLKTSIQLMDEELATQVEYLTPAAAKALLARVYLYKKEYQLAVDYATEIINDYDYKLSTGNDFRNMWRFDEGDEIIWKIGLTTTDAAGNTPGSSYYNDAQGLPNPDYTPTNNFLSLFTSNDIRNETYFVTEPTKYDNNTRIMTMVYKYPTNPAFTGIANANGANMPKPIRFAEMYLIRAEAYAMLTEASKAWDDIVTLRENRIDNYNGGNQPADIMAEIKLERKREFAFEGHLWFDYKRWNEGFDRQGRGSSGNNLYSNDVADRIILSNNFRWLWPIPQNEVEANSIIKKQQNPGY